MADLVKRAEGRGAVRRAADATKRVEYLAFLLAGRAYAVEIRFILEILKPPPITEVPRAPHGILGVTSVRGRLYTVIDLRRRFRLELTPISNKTRILLIDAGQDDPIGLLVDEVVQVYR